MEPSRPRERDRGCMRTRREVVEVDGSRHDLVRNGLLAFPFMGTEAVGDAADVSMLVSPMVGMLRLWPLLRTVESVLDTSQAHFWFLLITNWAEKCLKKEKTCRIFFLSIASQINKTSPADHRLNFLFLRLHFFIYFIFILKVFFKINIYDNSIK